MSSLRRSASEQYELIIECRSSGLSDHQWCLQHDIRPGTFYNWVKRLRKKKCYDIPPATRLANLTAAVKQDVVRVEILPDPSKTSGEPKMLSQASDITRIVPEPSTTAPIEIQMNEAVLRIRNDVDPQLLAQILRSLGGSAC